ncbi:hypothetical protein [Marinagarivorans cellulosilyticus]|uniref:Uncharacterized protein n=1 Tax=Marinagarivorans cellulosilyticus TaxID=2721545 RepID=A0AAN1WHF8_9GAMM|nr:hypothetical protein [Marinagarivorans cellulosilyticus]BCD97676.1 hypothetical protein MARGE09_P1877 [Marinagarivorans cellulosilyticus]
MNTKEFGFISFHAILVTLFLVFLVALFVFDEDPYTGWGEFETWADKDRKGEPVDCSALLSTEVERDYYQYNSYANQYERYTAHLQDYVKTTRYQFKQCREDIDPLVNQWCEKFIDKGLDSFLNYHDNDWDLPLWVIDFCHEGLMPEFKKVNSNFRLPDEEVKLLVLEDYGVMLDPSSIRNIRFEERYKDGLWGISLTADQKESTKDYYLNFSSKENWEQAKHAFAVMVSKYNAQD